jgi:hypothetical protein
MVAAGRAAITAFNEKATVPREEQGWSEYEARLFRYYHADSYYSNTVYSALVNYSARHKEAKKLYKFTRPVYNPVTRLCDLYPGKIYGGSIDMELLRKGAIPIAQADDPLREAIRQLIIWSDLGTQKSIYVRNGAKFGDSVIKVVDDRERQKVRLEMLSPEIIRQAEFDSVGNVKSVTIEYVRYDEQPIASGNVSIQQRKAHVYRETIDADWFRTYRDGEPYAYYTDANGTPVSEWPNEYGFVPLIIVQHKDIGLDWGANAFHASVGKIDELNDAASLLNDQVRKAVNLVWYFAGVTKRDELNINSNERDGVPVVYGPASSQPFPMVAQLDIAAAGENLQAMLAELERDMPELALHHIREGGNLTAPGVEAAYSDAIDKIVEARGNYDDGLVRAMQMGVSIGGHNGYNGFLPFSLDSYQRGDLTFTIADRPIVKDELSKKERIDLLKQSNAPDRAIWKELDIPDDTIDEWERDIQQQQGAIEDRLTRQIEAQARRGTQNQLTSGATQDA